MISMFSKRSAKIDLPKSLELDVEGRTLEQWWDEANKSRCDYVSEEKPFRIHRDDNQMGWVIQGAWMFDPTHYALQTKSWMYTPPVFNTIWKDKTKPFSTFEDAEAWLKQYTRPGLSDRRYGEVWKDEVWEL